MAGADTHCFRLVLGGKDGLRNHILNRFELAANEPDPAAAAYADLCHHRRWFHWRGRARLEGTDPRAFGQGFFLDAALDEIRVVRLEAGPGLLNGFPDGTAPGAAERLRAMGVDVRLGAKVAAVEEDRVRFADGADLLSDTVV